MKLSMKLSGVGTKILLCGLAAGVVTILAAMLFSFLILRGVIPEGQNGLYTGIISGLSVGLACIFACGKQTSATLPLCLGIASVYYVLVLLAKTVLFPGEAVGLLSRGLVVYLTATLLALLLTRSRKGRAIHSRFSKR